MTLSQIRSQVEALKRKYAAELEVYRLRELAHEFCGEMTEAVTGSRPGPILPALNWTRILFKRMSDRGFRLKNFVTLYDYLKRCLHRRVLPQVNGVLRSLLPKAAERSLIPRSIKPVPF